MTSSKIFCGATAPLRRIEMEFDVTSIAAALYDGGWRAGDYDWLVQEYHLTTEQAKAICDDLAAFAAN